MTSPAPNISIDKAWPGRYILNIKVTSTSDKLDATYFDCYNFMTCTSLKTIICIDNVVFGDDVYVTAGPSSGN